MNYENHPKMEKFTEYWATVQNGGKTVYPKVNTLITSANQRHAGSEFPEETLKVIHTQLQIEVFGRELPAKTWAWSS